MEDLIRLADKNMDGLISEHEFVLCCKAAMEAEDIKNRPKAAGTWGITQQAEYEESIRVFCVPSFMETILRIGVNYLNFHGTDAQSKLSTGLKVLWTIEYIASRFETYVKDKRPGLVEQFSGVSEATCRAEAMADKIRKTMRPHELRRTVEAESFLTPDQELQMLNLRSGVTFASAKVSKESKEPKEPKEPEKPTIDKEVPAKIAGAPVLNASTMQSASPKKAASVKAKAKTKGKKKDDTKPEELPPLPKDWKSRLPQDPLLIPVEKLEVAKFMMTAPFTTKLLKGNEAVAIRGVRHDVGFPAVDKHAEKKVGEARDSMWLNNVSELRLAAGAGEPGFDPPVDDVLDEDEMDQVKPLELAALHVPDLFQHFPSAVIVDDDVSDSETHEHSSCRVCGFEYWRGWGNARCYACSEATRLCAGQNFLFLGMLETEKQRYPRSMAKAEEPTPIYTNLEEEAAQPAEPPSEKDKKKKGSRKSTPDGRKSTSDKRKSTPDDGSGKAPRKSGSKAAK